MLNRYSTPYRVLTEEEKTEIINGTEKIVALSLQCLARIKERYDSCGNDRFPSVIMTSEPIRNSYRELLRKGVKPRCIRDYKRKYYILQRTDEGSS
jgi:hypothetical protein